MADPTPEQQLLHWQRLSLTLARLLFDSSYEPGLGPQELLVSGVAIAAAFHGKPAGLDGYTFGELAELAPFHPLPPHEPASTPSYPPTASPGPGEAGQ